MPNQEKDDVYVPVAKTYTSPAWRDRRPKRDKKGNFGTEQEEEIAGRGFGGQAPAWAESQINPPAWVNPYAPSNNLGLYNNSPYRGFQTPTTSGFTSTQTNTNTRNLFPDANTRWVRTDKGWQAVPLQPGMLTGSFFSGGSPALNPPSGEDYNWQGNIRNENVNVIPVTQPTTTTTGGGGSGSGGGWRGGGGGGGGGGTYQPRQPSWLMNLYNWNFKG